MYMQGSTVLTLVKGRKHWTLNLRVIMASFSLSLSLSIYLSIYLSISEKTPKEEESIEEVPMEAVPEQV